MSAPVGVLVMAHGTPATPEELAPFYTRIRRGVPPSPAQLEDLERRYRAIGGVSPLAERTRAQVGGLAAALEEGSPGRFTVGFGAKHTEPPIEAGAAELVGRGVVGVVGLVLTPHHSARGSGEYLDRAAEAVERASPGLPFAAVERWYDAPGFAELMARRVDAALAHLEDPAVLFTAHSVPEAGAGTYGDQVQASADLIAGAAGLAGKQVPWCTVFQSAGRTDQRWLGPDLLATIDDLGAEGRRSVLVCPVGFVSDHLEVLYDLDIEAAERATAAGLRFARTASLNDDPAFLRVLARVVVRAAGQLA
jgi:protoporphyrin/coproporphyrin ferrochelatase